MRARLGTACPLNAHCDMYVCAYVTAWAYSMQGQTSLTPAHIPCAWVYLCRHADVECLTFHADHKDPAFTASALRVLSQSLPTHVTKLGLILDSSKGPARILSYVHIVHHQIQIPVPADHVPAPPHVHMEVVPFHHMLQDFQQMLQHIQAIQPQAQPPPAEPQPAAGDDGGEQQAAPQQPQPGALQQALQLLGLQALPPQVLQFLQLLGQQVQQALQEAEDEPDQEQMTAFLQTRLLLPLLPSHVGTLCIEVVRCSCMHITLP